MCIEREKDNFKSREVNCLKECALALSRGPEIGSGSRNYRVLYRVSNWQYDRYDIITDISDANP